MRRGTDIFAGLRGAGGVAARTLRMSVDLRFGGFRVSHGVSFCLGVSRCFWAIRGPDSDRVSPGHSGLSVVRARGGCAACLAVSRGLSGTRGDVRSGGALVRAGWLPRGSIWRGAAGASLPWLRGGSLGCPLGPDAPAARVPRQIEPPPALRESGVVVGVVRLARWSARRLSNRRFDVVFPRKGWPPEGPVITPLLLPVRSSRWRS